MLLYVGYECVHITLWMTLGMLDGCCFDFFGQIRLKPRVKGKNKDKGKKLKCRIILGASCFALGLNASSKDNFKYGVIIRG